MDVLVIRFEDTDTTIFENSYGFLGRLLEVDSDNTIQLRYRGGDDEPIEFRLSTDDALTTELINLISFTIKAFGARGFTEEFLMDVMRYEVKDQNGDLLNSFENYGQATAYFTQWVKYGDHTLNGAGIFNNVNGGWEIRVAYDEDDE